MVYAKHLEKLEFKPNFCTSIDAEHTNHFKNMIEFQAARFGRSEF